MNNFLKCLFILTFTLFGKESDGSVRSAKEKEWLKKLNQSPYQKGYDPKELNEWFLTEGTKKGVILTLHGLNNRPSSMNSLIRFFNSQGLDVLRGALSGHRGSLDEGKNLLLKDWERETKDLYNLALKKALQLNVPLYLNCYSMGCLVLVNLIESLDKDTSKNRIRKILFISPALKVRDPFLFFYQIVDTLLPSDWILPSFNLKEYRSQDGTSVASYQAFFKLLKKHQELSLFLKKKLATIPSLILMNPKDELLSFSDLKNFIKDNGLKSWKMISIDNSKSKNSKKISHLLLDEKSVGHHEWKRMKKEMANFLGFKRDAL
jgi:esterase/lipase